jgi:signal transduction histidine kinase
MKRWLKLDPQYRIEKPRRHVIELARQVANEEMLRDRFEKLLCEWFTADKAELVSMHAAQQASIASALLTSWSSLSPHSDGWMTPETIQRKRAKPFSRECREFMSLNNLGAIVAVPKGSPNPSLIVLLGEKQSLRPYTFPDIQVLLELAELMDNILTHSRVATHAAHIERMASATMISRGLAHDLNNLATPVSTFLHHMDKRVTQGTVEAKVLADAKSSIRVMQDYIQESLFFARQLVPNLAAIEARSVLNDVVRLSSERAREKDIHVIIRAGPDFSFVADFSLLRRLLQNLVFNGIDASANGGTIEISASSTDDQQVCWQVADHGSGIPPEVRNRIFEPYYTTKGSGSERRGLGLGLAICQKIAEIHGGRISVSTNLPHGTVFTTTFPRKSAAPVMSPMIDAEPAVQDRRPAEPIHKLGPTQTVNGVYP